VRRITPLVVIFVLLAPATAYATDLGELLQRSQGANYSAEQIISCSTPDGARDAIVRITQSGNELTVASSTTGEVEVAAGSGSWSLRQGGGLVAEAAVGAGETEAAEPLYTVEEEQAVEYLGRAAMSYLLVREGEPRAELVIDDVTGAMVEAVTYTLDGDVYCERRFVSLDTDASSPSDVGSADPAGTPPIAVDESTLPEEVSGFSRLDQYEDEDGLRFAYYSDGFFSFAVFETPSAVALPDPATARFESGSYQRVFTAGQVTYVWETRDGGMALVGDLPPDLHEPVLAAMPHPQDPGFFRRWWRNFFG
jgi:hypothetical protein